jgi:aryl-phospho-beta-D-glucosidase BglC (GH1 family)
LAFLFIYFIYIQLNIHIFGSGKLYSFPGYHLRKRPAALYNSSTEAAFELPLPPDFEPPLRTYGRHILDSKNHHVKLKSINWYGASDIYFTPMGLDIRHRNQIAALIRHMGFNSVRLPYSDEMVVRNPVVDSTLLSANPDLIGLRALDIFAAVVEALTQVGLAVIPNDHITQATWCCGTRVDDMCDAFVSNDWYPWCRVKQSENDWLDRWRTVMSLFANDSLVIGADLRNEVRGIFGTMPWSRWAPVAERGAEHLLSINPDWLIFVEGVESANLLNGVRKRPIEVSVPNRIVYSAHVYSWSGWGVAWPYSKRPYDAFAKDMHKNWAYLLESNIAPVWVGEMGAPGRPSEGDYNYWNHLIQYLKAVDAHWAYWAINPRKPAGNKWESYGLVKDDWRTVRWDYRVNDLMTLGLEPM